MRKDSCGTRTRRRDGASGRRVQYCVVGVIHRDRATLAGTAAVTGQSHQATALAARTTAAANAFRKDAEGIAIEGLQMPGVRDGDIAAIARTTAG